MISATDPRVVSFYNFVNGKSRDSDGHYIGNPNNETGLLYVTGTAIQVWLPPDLLDYANAAAGTSGSNKRPVGIRISGFVGADRASDEIVRIFSSTTTLAKFLNDSECDYVGGGYKLGIKKIAALPDPLVKTDFWKKYDKKVLDQLVLKFSKTTVQESYNILTMFEFESRFGL